MPQGEYYPRVPNQPKSHFCVSSLPSLAAKLQAIGGAEYIDEAVPGMRAHSLVLWNSLTSVEQKRFNLVKP